VGIWPIVDPNEERRCKRVKEVCDSEAKLRARGIRWRWIGGDKYPPVAELIDGRTEKAKEETVTGMD
jgi:hypothetical protein